jgi:hypothetical protein
VSYTLNPLKNYTIYCSEMRTQKSVWRCGSSFPSFEQDEARTENWMLFSMFQQWMESISVLVTFTEIHKLPKAVFVKRYKTSLTNFFGRKVGTTINLIR